MTTETPRQHPSLRVPGVGPALVVTALVGALACGLAVVLEGRPQVVGAACGAAVVAVFFAFGMLNTAVAATFAPRSSLLVALVTYTVQVVALGLLLSALTRSETTASQLDVRWLGATVIAGAVGWSLALVHDALRRPLHLTSGEAVRG
jgi:ATP synthase protein I